MYALSFMGPEFNLLRKMIQKELVLTKKRTEKERNLRMVPPYLQWTISMVCGP